MTAPNWFLDLLWWPFMGGAAGGLLLLLVVCALEIRKSRR